MAAGNQCDRPCCRQRRSRCTACFAGRIKDRGSSGCGALIGSSRPGYQSLARRVLALGVTPPSRPAAWLGSMTVRARHHETQAARRKPVQQWEMREVAANPGSCERGVRSPYMLVMTSPLMSASGRGRQPSSIMMEQFIAEVRRRGGCGGQAPDMTQAVAWGPPSTRGREGMQR